MSSRKPWMRLCNKPFCTLSTACNINYDPYLICNVESSQTRTWLLHDFMLNLVCWIKSNREVEQMTQRRSSSAFNFLSNPENPKTKSSWGMHNYFFLLFGISYLASISNRCQELRLEVWFERPTLRLSLELRWTSPQNHAVASFGFDGFEDVQCVILWNEVEF